MKTSEHYDVIVIGAGSGNSIVNQEFAHLRVALVEHGRFGGTCINAGCIPTKMFVYPGDLARQATEGRRLGVNARLESVDWPAIRDRIFGRIDAISASGRRFREESPLTEVYTGTARFTGPNELALAQPDGSQTVITGEQIVVAAGSRPVIPDIAGLDEVDYHTSETVMHLDELPARVGIIGGGYVGCEFAHIFSAYGSQVTQVHTHTTLLNHHDEDIARVFTAEASHQWDLLLDSSVVRVERAGTGIAMQLAGAEGSTWVEVDVLLVAVGRTPNTDRLDVAAAGIAVDESGLVVVDAYQRTNVPGVWALGDVSNRLALKHVANHEARVIRHNLLHPDDLVASDHRFVPSAVFTHPQIASVGLTEEAARAAGIDVAVSTHAYGETAFGWAMEDTVDFVKLLGDRATGRLVGAHLIGPAASILIQPLIQAMSLEQPVAGLAGAQYWIHPALTEVVENALLKLERELAS